MSQNDMYSSISEGSFEHSSIVLGEAKSAEVAWNTGPIAAYSRTIVRMGGGRGAKRRVGSTVGHGTLRRAKLDPEHGRGVVHTSFLQALHFRASDGDTHWLYVVDQYGEHVSARTAAPPHFVTEWYRRLARGPEACAPLAMNSYGLPIEEDELFWVVGASEADLAPSAEASWPRAPLEPVPFMDALYLSAYPHGRLRDRDGQRCRVYAVEERSAGKGRRVPARYGIRFPDDDTYWVVPAKEIVLAPAYRR